MRYNCPYEEDIMAQKIFSPGEIEELRLNPYVKRVTEKSITYTEEFRELFSDKYQRGELPTQIFRECRFNISALGKDRIKEMSRRCKKMAVRPEGFADTRKGHSGRPVTRELSDKEKIARLEHQVEYLKQENEFLKKIEFLDKKAAWKAKQKQDRMKNTK
jgi:transposase